MGSGDTKPLAAWRAPPGAELPQHMAWVGCRAQRSPQQVMLTVVALALARNDSHGKHPAGARGSPRGTGPSCVRGLCAGFGKGLGVVALQGCHSLGPCEELQMFAGLFLPQGGKARHHSPEQPQGTGPGRILTLYRLSPPPRWGL